MGDSISVGFDAESLDNIKETLKENNIPILAGPIQPNPSIKFLYVHDPNGLKIQFIEFIK
jgi:lactoylglutathione lyase